MPIVARRGLSTTSRRVKRSLPAGQFETYSYDNGGNLASKTDFNGKFTTFAYDTVRRLLSKTPDPSLNQPTISFTYTTNRQPTTRQAYLQVVEELQGGSVTKGFAYGHNRLNQRIVNGATTRYLVDTNNPTGYAQVLDEIAGNQVTRTYTYGHNLISQRQLISGQWSVSFYSYDGQDSVRMLTGLGGAVTDTYTYDAFGSLIASTGNTPNEHLYAGEALDPNIGFYYLRARYMNPSSGRFLTMDSYEGKTYDPRTLHKYLYVGASPVDNADPSGNESVGEFAIANSLNGVIQAMSTIFAMVVAGLIVCALDYAVTNELNDEGLPTGGATPCDAPRRPRDPSLFHHTNLLDAAAIEATGFIRASEAKKFGGFTFPVGAYATDIKPTDPGYTQSELSALFYGGNVGREVSTYVEIAKREFNPLLYPGFPHQYISYAPFAQFPVHVKVRSVGINQMPP